MTKNFPGSAIALAFLLCLAVCAPEGSQAFRTRTPEKTDPLIVKAKTLLQHEDYEEALNCFRKLTQTEPKNYQGYLGIADCLYFQGDYAKAMEAVNTSISLNPKGSDTYRRRGKINQKLRQDDAAIEDYTSALANSPHNPLYLSDRSDVYYRKGDLKKALADINEYLSIVKKPNPMMYYTRSVMHTKLGNKAQADADRKRGDSIINGEY